MTAMAHEDFADFLRASPHLNTVLNRNEESREGKVTIGEWQALKTIQADADCRLKVLSKKLGLSRQRVSKILDDLKKAEHVSVKTSAFSDGKSINRLMLSTGGKKSLGAFEAKLEKALSDVSETDLRLLSKVSKKPAPCQPCADQEGRLKRRILSWRWPHWHMRPLVIPPGMVIGQPGL